MNATQPPNNLGPTLRLAVGLLSSPLVVGVPLVIVALAPSAQNLAEDWPQLLDFLNEAVVAQVAVERGVGGSSG